MVLTGSEIRAMNCHLNPGCKLEPSDYLDYIHTYSDRYSTHSLNSKRHLALPKMSSQVLNRFGKEYRRFQYHWPESSREYISHGLPPYHQCGNKVSKRRLEIKDQRKNDRDFCDTLKLFAESCKIASLLNDSITQLKKKQSTLAQNSN